ncbi:RNA polymerase sigma factor [Hirschia litorea]|uniref:RNA polymerase sigma factor n=1 Tax=Hirschia litorea TaxID=1199156 RepID=A0ABW2IP54_9PROT
MSKLNSTRAKTDKAGGIWGAFLEAEPVIRRLIKRIAPDRQQVEDITQETIMRALHAEKENEIEQPKAYLFMIARNLVKDELDRKSRSIIEFIDDYAPDIEAEDVPTPEEILDSRKRMHLFGEAVASLPKQCREVFVLKKVYGYSHKDISKKLGISISTTEKHTIAGLKRCREFMNARDASKVRRVSTAAPILGSRSKVLVSRDTKHEE